ncbi:MAG: hypothetical protein JWM02_2163 [Frankiales bacterium]|nr:hypothetical protein [Frankiales bacterium]
MVAKSSAAAQYLEVTVNGEPGVLVIVDGAVITAVAVEVADGLLTGVRIVSSPDKLASIRLDQLT